MVPLYKTALIVGFAVMLHPLCTPKSLAPLLRSSSIESPVLISQRKALKKQSTVSERYSIYSAAINYLYDSVYAKKGVALIVISDEAEYQQKLKRQLNLRTKYTLAPKSHLDALLYNQNKDAFFNRYKTAAGYLTLSEISFEGGTQAKLNVELQCGFLCGVGWYFRLSKADGAWTVEEQKVTWQK